MPSPSLILTIYTLTIAQTSPGSVHPPLHLRLNTPDEPGFILETIPVRTLKEVWNILEVRFNLTTIIFTLTWVLEI